MSFIDNFLGQNQLACASSKYDGPPTKPRTIRETLQDQMAYHSNKIKDLQAALDAMTPDVEKAFDALQKLSF